MKHSWLYIVLFVSSGYLKAQDAVWNAVHHNPLYINPAYASNPGQGAAFYLNTRNQWLNLPGATRISGAHQFNQYSYVTPISSPWLRGKYNGLGTSLQVTQSRAGEGRLSFNGISHNFGTYLPLRNRLSRTLAVYVGMGYSLGQYSLDWDQLVFSSQLDPYLGLINPNPLVNPQYAQAPSNISKSGQFGGFIHGSLSRRTFFRVGYGLFHFGPEIVTFFDQREQIAPRHSYHATLTYFPKSKTGLKKDFQANYVVLQQNIQRQYPLRTSETRLSVCNGGVLINSIGLRSKDFLALSARVDSWLYSAQFNTNLGMYSIGYEYTISKLNNGRSGGTIEIGMTLPLNASLGPKAFRKREPCFVEGLLISSEWKAVEKFSKAATSWGVQYSPVTFIP
jgi:type IX secretion system PorP/SprF family membrane protein